MASLTLDALSKRYPNGFTAVDDVSLTIPDGELLVLVGPSGSGKSTVIRLIAGIDEPTSGRVLIGDRDVTNAPPQERDVAMVFQSYALYPHKTVRENMAFGLRMRGVDPATIDERVRAAAVTLGIDALLDRRPAQLSGGQRQRVALGRAIVREPQAFLLDEPLSNLDPLLRVATRAELALLHQRVGVTMVYVTHDQEEAMTLGTRIAVMRDGRVQQVGPPMEVYAKPANSFVARFIGSPAMNLWPVTATGVDGPDPGTVERRLRLTSPAFTIDLASKNVLIAASHGESLLAGVRPHDVELCRPAHGNAAGRVALVEPLGPVSLVHVDVPGLPEMGRVLVRDDQPVRLGDHVGLRIRFDRLHLFGEEGRRIGD
jgi:multiple sugar transport system ATP-binding protein